jgi:hypothetical protein
MGLLQFCVCRHQLSVGASGAEIEQEIANEKETERGLIGGGPDAPERDTPIFQHPTAQQFIEYKEEQRATRDQKHEAGVQKCINGR